MNPKALCMGAVVIGTALAAANIARGEVAYPSGTQDFESMDVGDDITSIGWIVVNISKSPELFTVRAVDDPGPPPGLASTRWIRILDEDGDDSQNRFYSPTINAPSEENYVWTFHVNVETLLPGAGSAKPRFTIQHFDDGVGFFNAWGFEFDEDGVSLIVVGMGGSDASTPLYSFTPPTDIGDWVKLTFAVDFSSNTVSGSVNDEPPVSLPIDLVGDKKVFRFCYRGEGVGNVVSMLLDDVSLVVGEPQVIPATSTWGVVVMALFMLIIATTLFQQKSRALAKTT